MTMFPSRIEGCWFWDSADLNNHLFYHANLRDFGSSKALSMFLNMNNSHDVA